MWCLESEWVAVSGWGSGTDLELAAESISMTLEIILPTRKAPGQSPGLVKDFFSIDYQEIVVNCVPFFSQSTRPFKSSLFWFNHVFRFISVSVPVIKKKVSVPV